MASGGYIEQADFLPFPMCGDGTMPSDSIFKKWAGLASEFRSATGKGFIATEEVRSYLHDAGFVDIVDKKFNLPLGPWSKDERYREIGKVGSLTPRSSAL
jgi:hypothetical protein